MGRPLVVKDESDTQKMFEDTKGVIISRNSMNIQHNGQRKKNKKTNMVEKHREGSFIGGGDRSARGKSPTCRKSVANLIT